MKQTLYVFLFLALVMAQGPATYSQTGGRTIRLFTTGWKFYLGDAAGAEQAAFNDAGWRTLNLPHDWSIGGRFDEKSPAGVGGGALTGGLGWYRKTFVLPGTADNKHVFIDFDGVYRNSEVWINGHLLGKRPNGYISFRYDLTPYLQYGGAKNVIAVKVDNSKQPNSRWYSGSGIFRNVWLVTGREVMVEHWGTCVTTPAVTAASATIEMKVRVSSLLRPGADVDTAKNIVITTALYDKTGRKLTERSDKAVLLDSLQQVQRFQLNQPHLWSTTDPYLYKAVTKVFASGHQTDEYTTPFGIRYFEFDANKGFLLNGKRVKINGVCDHHDLGCLGSAINTRALERQLEILKAMGCNGIRTSHNPPAPELLDLCDRMGFIVMDEAFDMWKKEKNPYDYHLDWDQWHERDLKDQVIRDRNHPSVFIWSIGNEVNEQWDTTDVSGTVIARELTGIVHALDNTRPVTSALSSPYPFNPLVKADALDLIGYNYDHRDLPDFHKRFPGKKFIGTETVSALETRGYYDISIPSDSIRRWPQRWDKPLIGGTADHSVSAYD
ncbi:MAG TPA: glycoside hydrolase family 2 TIM barrel-domain containing protein, partial [Chitinophagaceae bacterium]|nr:glycoside hydrolase family 2 TIM barrel-domain containing protein [Chitinophagaceae bacterium]